MNVTLEQVVGILRSNADVLRARGILHAAVFGSVARGEARPESDIDILVEREALRPLVREEASRDAVNVF
jgi:hypothetical protein